MRTLLLFLHVFLCRVCKVSQKTLDLINIAIRNVRGNLTTSLVGTETNRPAVGRDCSPLFDSGRWFASPRVL